MANETLSPQVFPARAKSKPAAIYTRVSTGDQHIETQLYDLREMARLRGYEVVAEYSDRDRGFDLGIFLPQN
jgi:resolvase-like protein